jgi:HPt (histidine-containing phosphotransfer) domain-containing protein
MIHQMNRASEWDSDALNREELVGRLLGNAALAQRMLSQFLDAIPEEIDLLESVIRIGDPKEVMTLAHRHKGTAKTLAARQVAEVASEIERQAREGSTSNLLSLLDELRTSHTHLQDELEAWAREASDGASE